MGISLDADREEMMLLGRPRLFRRGTGEKLPDSYLTVMQIFTQLAFAHAFLRGDERESGCLNLIEEEFIEPLYSEYITWTIRHAWTKSTTRCGVVVETPSFLGGRNVYLIWQNV